MDDKIKGLFPITQAAAVCGLSRSTLLRMEEKGLLTPAYIASKSGRRYYDNDNISRILHVQQFQSMGFGPEETASYFAKGGDAAELLAILEDRLNLLQRNVEELRIRAAANPDMSVQIMTLPETVCCMRRCTGLTIQEKYDAMYDFFHECVENGYVLAREPLFVIHERTDYLEGQLTTPPIRSRHVCPSSLRAHRKTPSASLPARCSPSYFTAITAAWMKHGSGLAGKRRSADLSLPHCRVQSASWHLIPGGISILGNIVQGL